MHFAENSALMALMGILFADKQVRRIYKSSFKESKCYELAIKSIKCDQQSNMKLRNNMSVLE